MNNQTVFWLWIQNVLGFASNNLSRVAEQYTFAEDFYRSPTEEKLKLGFFDEESAEKFKEGSLNAEFSLIERCKKVGIDIVSYGDEAYPDMLRKIKAPPVVLFVRGDVSVLSKTLNIAMVGTRSASIKGCKDAMTISRELASKGVCIVSGGAVGIDTQSHMGALRANGKTVCVLGCGHECGYLRDLEHIKREIVKNGAVISEYPPDMHPSRYTFPQRNRIISGISSGVVVVEAGRKSGSLITMRMAAKQGRKVFAVVQNNDGAVSLGTQDMIREGAIPVKSAADILAEFGDGLKSNNKEAGKKSGRLKTDSQSDGENVSPTSYTSEDLVLVSEPIKSQLIVTEIPIDIPDELNNFADYVLSKLYVNGEYLVDDETVEHLKKRAEEGRIAREKYEKRLFDSAHSDDDPQKKEKKPAQKRKRPEPKKKPLPPETKPETEHTPAPQPQALEERKLPEDISDEALAFLKALGSEELHIDQITERTGLPISAVHAAATELEMNDLIESLQGRRYRAVG